MSSKPFRFTVGRNKREFMMHSALVASLSPVLDVLVNGPMKEAHELHVVWDDIDESTFILFSQYAYTGDYGPIEPEASKPEVIPEPVAPTPPRGGGLVSIVRDDNSVHPFYVHETFQGMLNLRDPTRNIVSLQITTISKREQMRQQIEAAGRFLDCTVEPRAYLWRQSNFESEDFTNVFFSHARLYVFADRYKIEPLKTLSRARLASILTAFDLHEQGHKDFMNLVKFCYDDEPVPEKLKELVVLYTACELNILWKSDEFQQFYVEQGKFARDVTAMLLQTLDSN